MHSLNGIDIRSVNRYNGREDVMTMNLQTMLKEKGMTMYHLSKASGVPKTTVRARSVPVMPGLFNGFPRRSVAQWRI